VARSRTQDRGQAGQPLEFIECHELVWHTASLPGPSPARRWCRWSTRDRGLPNGVDQLTLSIAPGETMALVGKPVPGSPP
jgi:hypothetical protein